MKSAPLVALAVLAVLALSVLTAACSSEADAFEKCDVPGGTRDVCVNGTVCGKPTDKSVALVCIPVCIDDKTCPKGQSCKGVDGTNVKGCRAD
jgi:hypothetical protein